jgi:hypothetical protein
MSAGVPFTLPSLYGKQWDAVNDPARIVCIESTTKAGKTLGCVVWQVGQIMSGPPDVDHWWVAPVYDQSMMALDLAWGLLRGAPGFRYSRAERSIVAPGNRRWRFRSADNPDSLYGSAVYSLVLDECSRIKDAAVDACFSTTTRTRGRIRCIGNVRGRSNRHYQFSRKGEAGELGFSYHRITADDAVDAGIFARSDLELARRTLPEAVFRELYYCEPADEGGNPFGISAIRNCAELCNGRPSGDTVRIWGLDIARKRDYAVLIGLDAERRVACLHRWYGLTYAALVESVAAIVGRKSKAAIFYDATGVGDAVGEQLVAAGLFCEPFIFSSPSKQGLIEGLALALQSGRTTVLDGVHRSELEAFEYDVRGGRVVFSAPAGSHDDTVCAHALAWYGAERMGVRPGSRKSFPVTQSAKVQRVRQW